MTNLVKVTPTQSALALKMPPADFLKEFSPKQCLIKYIKTDTPALALKADSPTLALINKQYGHKYVIGLLSLFLINLSEFLGRKFEMSKLQIEETSELLYADYYYLNLADVNAVFRRIKTNTSGLYEQINGAKILEKFSAYSQERAETARQFNDEKSEIIQKHGYDKSKEIADETKIAEMILEKKMEAAQREAQLELADLNRQYHLQSILAMSKKSLFK
jgi:hypothetical protein